MSKKYGTFSGKLLKAIGQATGFFSWPPDFSLNASYKDFKGYSKKRIYDDVYRLQRQGLVKILTKNGKKFIQLTQKGELETLLFNLHANSPIAGSWDLCYAAHRSIH